MGETSRQGCGNRLRRRLAALAATSTVAALTVGTATLTPARAQTVDPALASLPPALPNGTRPGPPVLYAPAPAAPQLANHSSAFQAPPLLVSGTEAYAAGEYLYQGYLYADHGGGTNGTGPGGYVGNLTYPTDLATYGNNAANLVEFRVSTLEPGQVAYRFTLNTLLKPATTIITLAYDTDGNSATGCSTLPHSPGAPFPGTDQVLTTWGTGADYGICRNGQWSMSSVPVTEDMASRQITVTVPRTLSDPHGVWKATLGAGLYDGHGGWLMPQATADATHPGGASSSGPNNGIFDLGFRFGEPVSAQQTLPLFSGVGDSPDTEQAAALAANDPVALQHPIDFSKLDTRADSSTVPATGVQVRILASRVSHGQGMDNLGHPVGNLEPYTVVIPSSYRPGNRLPLMLALHSLGDHYWQFTQSEGQHDWADGHQYFVVTPEARGPDTGYVDEAEYDVFEVWNDVARHFDLAPGKAIASGYSMGGVGTQWLSSLYPDLFARAYEVVGGAWTTAWVPPLREDSSWRGDMELWIENMRNVPVLDVYGGEDEFGGAAVQQGQNLMPGGPFGKGLDQLGYRYEGVTYPVAEHLTFAGAGYVIPTADPFLDDPVVASDPAHVTFSYVPVTDDPTLNLVHNHAYWVSDISLADPDGAPPLTGAAVSQATGGFTDDTGTVPKATVDAVSAAFGVGDPTSYHGATAGVGPLVLPYVEYYQDWNAAPKVAPANHLTLSLTNVGRARYDLAAAHLDPSRPIIVAVTTSTATELLMDDAFTGHPAVLVDGKVVRTGGKAGELSVPVAAGSHTVTIDPAS